MLTQVGDTLRRFGVQWTCHCRYEVASGSVHRARSLAVGEAIPLTETDSARLTLVNSSGLVNSSAKVTERDCHTPLCSVRNDKRSATTKRPTKGLKLLCWRLHLVLCQGEPERVH